jgi:acetolactate synthase-1/2/3 large subunit
MLQIELRNLGVNDVGRNATRMMSLDEPALDWAKLANGMGIEAVGVGTNEALADILPLAMRRSGPFLIECILD